MLNRNIFIELRIIGIIARFPRITLRGFNNNNMKISDGLPADGNPKYTTKVYLVQTGFHKA